MSLAPATDSHLAAYSPRMVRTWPGETPGYRQVEGTLVFADVSGFTRLTERLSRRGKVGAEEMVTIISDVWEALLASDDGGDVLKFAGDALILFYQGPGHAARACQGALAMQRELARVGRIESSSGVVRLRMSIGTHSGTFHFFLVGGHHLELLVLGEAATVTVDMEAAASAGQVLVSHETARHCQGAKLGRHVGEGVIVRSVPPQPLIGPGPVGAERPPHQFVSPLLRDRLGDVEHEHRWVSVAFAQLGGVDGMLRDRGPHETFERVQAFSTAAMEILADYGVLLSSCDVGRDGAIFMMTAGVPNAGNDDEARMLRVARRLVEVDVGLAVRAGVNAGNVFVGDVGPSFRRAYVSMGDTTNLAARVTGKAPWGGVLATYTILEAAGGRFSTRPVEPFFVKGKRRAVEAALVEGVREVSRQVFDIGPFIGRDREHRLLLEALADARRGVGRVVEIIADEGSGKSRLVAEIRKAAGDMGWLAVSCDPFERTSPYHSARSLLRRALGIPLDASPNEAGIRLTGIVGEAAPHLLPWLPLLAVPVGAIVAATPEANEVAEQYRRVRTQQVVADLMEAFVVNPAVVVLEDASSMDDASAELVAELLGRIAGQPWLTIITRVEDTSGLHRGRGYEATTIRLDPLSEEQATELAMRLAETTPVPRHLLPEMVSRSGGNPLFLAELIARAGTGDADMPHSVEGIIAARIDGLAPEDRRALRYLSVLGERFDKSMLDETLTDLGILSDNDALWDRLAAFVGRDDQQFVFSNRLVRQVAYEGLPYGWRREIHSRVADVLSRRRDDQLPFHLVRAERWAEAWEAARRAGDRARRAGANAVAGELYELALEAANHVRPPAPDVATVAANAGLVWTRVGIPKRALDAYGTAISMAPTATERLLLASRRAAVHENAGRFPQALGLYARALSEAENIPDPTDRHRCFGVLHAGYASTRHRQGQFEKAIEHAEKAATEAEAAGDRETLAYAYHLLDRIHTATGSREEGLHYRDAALPIFAELGDLAAQGTVLHDLAADAHRGGRLEEATWLYDRAIDARTRVGDVVRAAASVNALGEVEMELGMLDRAERRFTDALRTWRGARSPEGISVATANLGSLRLSRDDLDGAVEKLEEAHALADAIGAESLLHTTGLLLAEVYVRLGRWVEAWKMATEILDSGGDSLAIVRARRLRAQALSATGGDARAWTELTEALDLADRSGLDDEVTAIRALFDGV